MQLPLFTLLLTAGFATQTPSGPDEPVLAFGDLDHDGLADLAVLDDRGVSIHRNVGRGAFEDVTATSGVVGKARAASWLDIDGDGALDLHLVRPDGASALYRNVGGAKFEDATAASALDRAPLCSRAAWLDYDKDGRADLALWTARGVELLHNDGRGVLEPTPFVWSVPTASTTEAPQPANPAPAQGASSAAEPSSGAPGASSAAAGDDRAGSRGAGRSQGVTRPTRSAVDASSDSLASSVSGSAQPSTSAALGSASIPCLPGVEDQAFSGNCIGASSVPELGKLFPISPELFVATNGDVGLGTVTPHGELHVQGDATTTVRLDTANANGTSRLQLLEDDNHPFASGAELSYDGANDRLQLSTITGILTTPRLVIERSNANEVGLNVADPKASLHVVGGATLGSLLVAPNESTGGKDSQLVLGEDDDASAGMKLIYRGASDRLDFRGLDNGVETQLVTIERSGDVGIGTNAPASPLHVVGTAATLGKFESSHTTASRIELSNTDIGGRSFDLNSTGSAHGAGAGKLIVRDVTAGANRMTIDSTGKLGVGTSSPTERLHVAGNIRVNDNSDIYGLDELVGFDNLRLSGDSGGGPDLVIDPNGAIDLGGNFAIDPFGAVYVGPNPGGVSCNFFTIEAPNACLWDILRVEDVGGASVLSVAGADNITGADAAVTVTGDFSVANGSKNFVLDHPLDPANLKLAHNAVEGPGYYTFYRGNVVLDAAGEAWVELPAYFDALNAEPSYQLTCIGGFAPVYVAEEVAGNRFRIAGGRAGSKVSWQVTALRDDPYAREHPYQVETPKSEDERGRFFYPRGFGAGPEQQLGGRRNPPDVLSPSPRAAARR